jgi:serine/threonine-protein kinase
MNQPLAEPAPRPRARSYIAFTLFGAVAAFVVAVVLVNFFLLPWHVNIGREAVVPDVTGKTPEEAVTEIRSKGFAPGDVRYVADAVYPAGKVVDTRPKAGARVKVGRAVSLDVSAGEEKTQVPQVYRLPVRRAQAAIENAGLRVGEIATTSSSKIPEGQVIGSEPVSGTKVTKGTPVNLTVSLGAEGATEMPRLRGLQLDRARDAIINCRLVLLDPTEVSSPEPAGTVLTQNPAEGTEVQPGDTVRLTVAKPPAGKPPTGKSRKLDTSRETKPSGDKTRKTEPAKGKEPGKTK